MPIQIDPHLIPTTLDLYHLILIGLTALLAILQIALLSVAVMALLRQKSTATQAVIQREPPEVPSREAVRAEPAPAPAKPVLETVIVKQATPDAALQLLGLLQKEARFVDFVNENLGAFSDAEIGAAARVVHDGCRKVVQEHFVLEPVRTEAESARLTLPKGYDAASVRVSGHIVGEAPFTGTLIHRGWKATGIKLPRIAEGHDVNIIAQAEVEL